MTLSDQMEDIENSVIAARECGDNIEKMMGLMADTTDEAKLIFWQIFLAEAAATAVKQISPQTTFIILNSLISAIQEKEINTKFH